MGIVYGPMGIWVYLIWVYAYSVWVYWVYYMGASTAIGPGVAGGGPLGVAFTTATLPLPLGAGIAFAVAFATAKGGRLASYASYAARHSRIS